MSPTPTDHCKSLNLEITPNMTRNSMLTIYQISSPICPNTYQQYQCRHICLHNNLKTRQLLELSLAGQYLLLVHSQISSIQIPIPIQMQIQIAPHQRLLYAHLRMHLKDHLHKRRLWHIRLHSHMRPDTRPHKALLLRLHKALLLRLHKTLVVALPKHEPIPNHVDLDAPQNQQRRNSKESPASLWSPIHSQP